MTNEDIDQIIDEEIERFLKEKKDACYHKVKSRYKVWHLDRRMLLVR